MYTIDNQKPDEWGLDKPYVVPLITIFLIYYSPNEDLSTLCFSSISTTRVKNIIHNQAIYWLWIYITEGTIYVEEGSLCESLYVATSYFKLSYGLTLTRFKLKSNLIFLIKVCYLNLLSWT